MSGSIHGIGVGPGDPELLTLKASRLIAEADVVAYPCAEGANSFARDIVASHLGHALEEPIVVPMVTERHPAQHIYNEAAARLSHHYNAGHRVVVLCEGDPFFFGSFMYLFDRLASTVPVEVVPGVSSLVASAAAIPRPLAARNDVLMVLSSVLPNETLAKRLHDAESVAFIKVGRHFQRLRKLLRDQDLEASSYYCERIGTSNQRVERLDEVTGTAAPYFSMILTYRGSERAITRGAQR